jgi:DHA1 family bicyclomycin/chloramphenicol resistance-like MFS transporter
MAAAALSGFDGPMIILPLLFVLLGSYGFLQGNTMAGALNADPTRAGTISALLGAASFAAGALAASVAAAFNDTSPTPMAAIMFVAQLGSAASLWFLALPRRPQG